MAAAAVGLNPPRFSAYLAQQASESRFVSSRLVVRKRAFIPPNPSAAKGVFGSRLLSQPGYRGGGGAGSEKRGPRSKILSPAARGARADICKERANNFKFESRLVQLILAASDTPWDAHLRALQASRAQVIRNYVAQRAVIICRLELENNALLFLFARP